MILRPVNLFCFAFLAVFASLLQTDSANASWLLRWLTQPVEVTDQPINDKPEAQDTTKTQSLLSRSFGDLVRSPKIPDLKSVEVAALDIEQHDDNLFNHLAFSLPDSSLESGTPQQEQVLIVTVEKGDTLSGILTRQGVNKHEVGGALEELKKHFDLRDLRAGWELEIGLNPRAPRVANGRLVSVTFQPSIDVTYRIWREKDGFAAMKDVLQLTKKVMLAKGKISNGLWVDANAMGVPNRVIGNLISIFAYSIDFQREIHQGDQFEAVYEALYNDQGKFVRTGSLLYGSFTIGKKKKKELYRFKNSKGSVSFFSRKGSSARRTLLRTPVDGARITSRYGRRKHPILGYTKKHKGVDFGAKRGTPVYSAGAGVVNYAGWRGSYGKYVRVRHNGTYQTAYAHLSKVARGIRSGKRVRQGQVIGYVGSTGRSTGPHLHYEVLKNGGQINPLKLTFNSRIQLGGKELKSFKSQRDRILSLKKQATELGPVASN